VAVLLCCLQLVVLHTLLLTSAVGDEKSPNTDPASAGPYLQARPGTCVALHKGQVCFQKVSLSWNSPDAQRMCLFIGDTEQALHCSSKVQATYVHAYQSKTSQQFYLRKGEAGPVLAAASVNTAWVYRTGRRSSSSWRLF